jgi:4-hydroxybenzoate polyprenyltransferase
LNDILDRKSDAEHPLNKRRPLPSGEVSVMQAAALCVVLFIASFAVLVALEVPAFGLFLAYFCLAQIYTFFLKKVVILDVALLAVFYTYRVFMGMTISDLDLSFWLLSFCCFFFLGLAFMKRLIELQNLNEGVTTCREYTVSDIPVLRMFGIASTFSSLLVFTLYLNSDQIQQLYTQPNLFWGVSFVILLWCLDAWMQLSRNMITKDPVLYFLTRKRSYLYVGAVLALILFAI